MTPQAWIAIVGLALGLVYQFFTNAKQRAEFEGQIKQAVSDQAQKISELRGDLRSLEAEIKHFERRQKPAALARVGRAAQQLMATLDTQVIDDIAALAGPKREKQEFRSAEAEAARDPRDPPVTSEL